MSPFEQAGRASKVLKITMALDGALDMMGCDPFSPRALEHILAMDTKAWSEAAKHALVPLASLTTQRMVEDLYRARIETRACLSRIA